MPDTDLNETQPNMVPGDTPANLSQPAAKKFPFWLPLLIAIVLIALGLVAGYSSGMDIRYSAENTIVNGQLADQFKLGQEAMNAGQYGVALDHFEFVLNERSQFPGHNISHCRRDACGWMSLPRSPLPQLHPSAPHQIHAARKTSSRMPRI